MSIWHSAHEIAGGRSSAAESLYSLRVILLRSCIHRSGVTSSLGDDRQGSRPRHLLQNFFKPIHNHVPTVLAGYFLKGKRSNRISSGRVTEKLNHCLREFFGLLRDANFTAIAKREAFGADGS